MTKIYDLLAKQNGKGISHFRYGYSEIPTAMLTFYDLSDLNNPNFDFRTAKPKKVKSGLTQFSDSRKVIWYEESIKEASFAADGDAAAGVTEFNVTIDTLQVCDTIRNTTTNESMLVTAVNGATITVAANVKGVSADDVFVRYGFAKKYMDAHTRTSNFNDLVTNENYVQFVAESIDPEKTDMLTNNLNRYLYKDANEYILDLFAQASRSILKTMVYGLYVGKARTTSVGGKTVYEAGGLEHFIPSAFKYVNIKGGTDKETIQNIRKQLQLAYQSGVDGLYKAGRMVLFVNSSMNGALDDIFFDKITQLDNHLSSFGINVRRLDLSGYKIDIVEDAVLNELYPGKKVAYLVDLESIFMYNLAKGVIAENGKTTEAPGVSKLFVPAQITPEMREVQLHTSFTYVIANSSAGVHQSWIYEG